MISEPPELREWKLVMLTLATLGQFSRRFNSSGMRKRKLGPEDPGSFRDKPTVCFGFLQLVLLNPELP